MKKHTNLWKRSGTFQKEIGKSTNFSRSYNHPFDLVVAFPVSSTLWLKAAWVGGENKTKQFNKIQRTNLQYIKAWSLEKQLVHGEFALEKVTWNTTSLTKKQNPRDSLAPQCLTKAKQPQWTLITSPSCKFLAPLSPTRSCSPLLLCHFKTFQLWVGLEILTQSRRRKWQNKKSNSGLTCWKWENYLPPW